MAEGKTRVILFGLGPIGAGIARLVAQRDSLEIVGAVDVDPAKVGKDVGEVIELGRKLGVAVSGDVGEVLRTRADIVVHATGSYLEAVGTQFEMILRSGHNVVSTCEELAEPWAEQPAIADELDRLAREHGVTILGTGINPGYVMDALPLTLTAACQQVDSIITLRIVDASKRRQPLQKKIGTGLTPEEFRARAARKEIRHVGLTESVAMIARGLGWTLDQIEEEIAPVVASEPVKTAYFEVAPGYVTGTHQFGYGLLNGERVITLELRMSVDAGQSIDEIWIEGPSPLHARIEGVQGDMATAAVVVNSIHRVVAAPAGLVTMVDLPLVSYRR
jgi:2,4-diaminopentanoate dehydrogenase